MEKHSSRTSRSTVVGTGHGLADVTPTELSARMTKINALLAQVETLLDGTVTLDDPERKSAVKLRGDDEVVALNGVLQFAAAHEPLFDALADEDEGVDPTKFETALVTNRLSNAQALSALGTRIGVIQQRVSDTALYATALSKPIALKAWEVAKVYVDRYPEQKAMLAPAVNFYRGKAIAAAKTRARNKAQEQASADPPVSAPTAVTPQK